MSNCLSSQPQAYLQQAQDLVILESIILQTLGKFGRKSWVHVFPLESHVICKNNANLFDSVCRLHLQVGAGQIDVGVSVLS